MYSYYPQATATTTVVSTEGRVWNGSSWGTALSSTSSTYNSTSETSLVQRYTEYYNSYQAFAQQAQAQADTYAASPAYATQRDEWLRHVTWYKYYADQSSRAAHYYYQNPNTSTPPPFELPPPPPIAGDEQSSNSLGGGAGAAGPSNFSHSANPQQQQQQQQPVPSVAVNTSGTAATPANPNSSPDALKHYFHKCLNACITDEQKKEVQAKLQQMMADALQAGTFHSMNWDTLELVHPTSMEGPNVLPISAPSAGAVHQNKRGWTDVGAVQSSQPAAAATYVPKNKRNRFGAEAPNSTLGNHDYAFGRTTNLTPPLTENTTTRVTPPLEAGTTSSVNYYGPSVSSSPHQNRYNKQLPSNDSYYGPKGSSPPSRQWDNHNNNSHYGGSVSGSSEEDFVAVPKFGGSKKYPTNQKGFERSHTKLAKRANRFGNATATTVAASTAAAIAESSNFDKYMGKGMIGGSNKKLEEYDYEMMTVKGTCTRLEKEYLRLTAPPRAELVRPQYILEQHYRNLVSEWKETSRRRDYLWFCSQFKALRQDCRVQRIQNAFCVRVYETHARIALESNDVNEFNQCQTQLMELYDLLLSPCSNEQSSKEQDDVREHRNEFLAYRFIYYVFLTGSHKGSSSSSDLMTLMLSLTPEQWKDPAIAHAARFREAVALEDYHAFFRLRRNCPNLGAYLVDRMVPLIRFKALQRICKAYRPSVELSFVLAELGFDQEEAMDGREWLESCGCILKNDMVVTKDSVVRESNLQVKQSLI